MNDRPTRVLHVLGELRPSGAERMLSIAAPLFTERGVTADILSTGSVPGAFSDKLQGAGYGIHHIPFSKSLRFFSQVYRLMRHRYDVVHLHTERANFWLGLTALLSGASVVVRTIHSSFAFTGALRVRRKIQRQMLHALGVRHVAVGASVQDTEARCFGVHVDLVHNWYDVGRFTPPQEADRRSARLALNVADEDLVLVSVGNCGPAKNHERLIEALSLLPTETRPLYLHVGAERPDRRERRLVEQTGIADRVRFIGQTDDVRMALYAADAFVMPSLYEGCGIAAIEAMAVGLPAVLADVSGLRDFRSQFNGLIYAQPDAEPLAAALRGLLSLGRDELRRISRGHPATAQVAYGVETGVARYLNLYRASGH